MELCSAERLRGLGSPMDVAEMELECLWDSLDRTLEMLGHSMERLDQTSGAKENTLALWKMPGQNPPQRLHRS